ncbi:polymeric immunoglobulin receptor-like [Salminus brasiliensis]|uniref:polymeric immunoglobulin receptor-like n=1 Tax=Salminus brasiliensis TaxID=930266 RepID=UPI003B831B31
MKILLIFTFLLISGLVGCFEVSGYTGGSVMIYCTLSKTRGYNGYFRKVSTQQDVYLNPDRSQTTWDHKGKVSLFDSSGYLTVIYRDLSLKDAGLYQCGETGDTNHNFKLEVKTDPCCLGPKTVTGYLGETVTISCSYPEKFQNKTRFFFKEIDQNYTEVIRTSESQKDRFSISDDRSSKVVSVRISDIREKDGGVYTCGVAGEDRASNYKTLFTKIHLQVTARDYSAAIIVSVCVVLLLIAALVFFMVMFRKRRGSTPAAITDRSGIKEVPAVVSDYEEIKATRPENASADASSPANSSDKTLHSTVQPPKDQDLTYSTVSFQKNPDSPSDVNINISKEEPDTEYAIIKHHTGLE